MLVRTFDLLDEVRRRIGQALDLSPATQANGTRAASARSIIPTASWGLVAKPMSVETWAAFMRVESLVQLFGRYSARSMKAWP
jgi:hypothetical protein